MKVLKFLPLLFPLTSIATVKLNVETSKVINITSDKYLSFGLDTAQVVGSYWWDKEGKMTGGRGKNKTTPLNLKDQNLLKYTKELSPAYLRIGGSEADALYYQINNDKKPKKYDSVLSKKRWKEIEGFVTETQTQLFFTLNQGPSSWDKNKKWNSTNLKEFTTYLKSISNIPITFELGNEVFAYWAIFGLSNYFTEQEYAKNYVEAKKILNKDLPDAKLAGPASAYWPVIGEPLGFIFNKMEDLFPILKNELDIITWHYYPTQSFRCPLAIRRATPYHFLKLSTYNEIRKWAKEVVHLRDKYSPKAKLWLGETGSAQCGGEPEISTTFASSLWWIDQLGILAQLKHDTVIRHNLIHADYALLNNDGTPRSDYYLSWLWKRFMGTKVFQTKSSDDKLRIYAHCSPKSQKLNIVLLNLSKHDINYEIDQMIESSLEVKSAKKDIFNKDIFVNNKYISSLEILKDSVKNKQKHDSKINAWNIKFLQTNKMIEQCR